MKSLVKALTFIPLMFTIYMMYVCFFGGIVSLIFWDWSIIPDNVLPWRTANINSALRSFSGVMAFTGSIMLLRERRVK